MKKMFYSAKRLNPPERLADGEYKGFRFYVLTLGTHPCAYVDVTETDLYGKHYSDIDIECHCGLTYSREYLHTVDKKGWFIGWDYAHYCDFAGYELETPMDIRTNGKRWTTAEIVNECKQVIDQLQTENANLRKVAEDLKAKDETRHKVYMTKCEELEIVKTEAIKEFAERLKQGLPTWLHPYIDLVEKEMAGEE